MNENQDCGQNSMNSTQKSVDDKIIDMLGFDPCKQNPSSASIRKALEEIVQEREVATQAKSKEMLLKVIELKQEQEKEERNYKASRQRFEKAVNKLLNNINNFSQGKDLETDPSEYKLGA